MDFIERFTDNPTAVAEEVGAYEFVGVILRDRIADSVSTMYEYGWEDGAATLSHLIGSGIDLEFSSVKAGRFADEHCANLITQINESTRDMIRDTIASSVKAEESWEDLKGRLLDNYAFSDRRAETIARTESGTAYNIGAVQAWQESGLVTSVEVVDGDEFDDECSQANGQIWTFEQAEANPLEHPNCVREFFPILGAGDKAEEGE